MEINIPMKAQEKNNGRAYYVHINPTMGRKDGWGLVIDETPNFDEGGVE